jgi:c-di-GMP-related signal transduction protein
MEFGGLIRPPRPADTTSMNKLLPRLGGPEAEEAAGSVFIARQPILTAGRKLYAFELLYRARGSGGFGAADGNHATEQVIANGLTSIGLAKLAGGRPVFVNFTRDLLLGSLPFLLPKGRTVIEVLEDVALDAEVIERCRELRKAGYDVALDDVEDRSRIGQMANVANYVKVDLRLAGRERAADIARYCASLPACLLAEKVETRAEFQFARALGYKLFQGYYFERPEVVSGHSFAPMKQSFAQMQRELNQEEFDYQKIEKMLRADPAMTHRLLRYLNSASFAMRGPVKSVRQAMVLLGETELRRWLFLVGLTKLAGPGNAHAVRSSLLRARYCEILAPRAGMGGRGQELFLMGLLSVLGAMLGATMEETVSGLGLSADVCDTLTGDGKASSRLGMLYLLARAYERGDWAPVTQLLRALGMAEDDLGVCYGQAVECTEQVIASLG